MVDSSAAWEILQQDIRFSIFSLLAVYPELSLAQLSKKLQVSKSTLHPHIQKLLEVGILQMVREEKVRGDKKAHIYALNENLHKLLLQFGPQLNLGNETLIEGTSDYDEKLLKTLTTFAKFNRLLLDGLLLILKKIGKSTKDREEFDRIAEQKELISSVFFLSEQDFMRFRLMYMKMIDEFLKTIPSEKQANPQGNPYYLYVLGVPIKDLFELLFPIK